MSDLGRFPVIRDHGRGHSLGHRWLDRLAVILVYLSARPSHDPPKGGHFPAGRVGPSDEATDQSIGFIAFLDGIIQRLQKRGNVFLEPLEFLWGGTVERAVRQLCVLEGVIP